MKINSLPLNGRVFSQLVQTVPGSVATGFGFKNEQHFESLSLLMRHNRP
jgi:hypothetical protein